LREQGKIAACSPEFLHAVVQAKCRNARVMDAWPGDMARPSNCGESSKISRRLGKKLQ
jgi:hypothetical protein